MTNKKNILIEREGRKKKERKKEEMIKSSKGLKWRRHGREKALLAVMRPG